MPVTFIHLPETTSTNSWLQAYTPQREDMTVVSTDYQTAGRGCGTNRWESERGQNLLFSVLTHPRGVAADRQFVLSMAEAVAVRKALERHGVDIRLKWPNDLYWQDLKLGGTLIETTLAGKSVRRCVFGTGINVNQTLFRSGAPNPVSLRQILGHPTDCRRLLQDIVGQLEEEMGRVAEGQGEAVRREYLQALYRRHGLHAYEDCGGRFRAETVDVEPSGTLVLRLEDRSLRRYTFKEIKFIL